MTKKWEIVLAGSGGQGMILAGILLGQAATAEGYHAAQTQSYGIATRGGVSLSEVVISDSEIINPKATDPDLILALTQETFDIYYRGRKPGTLMIIDTDGVSFQEKEKKIVGLPLTRYSREMGNPAVINMMSLGAVVGLTNIIPFQAVEAAIQQNFKPKVAELNKAAFQKGFQLTAFHKCF